MPDRIVLWDRLYEAVLEMTGIPRSQLDMLLASPDPVAITDTLSQLVVGKCLADKWERMKKDGHAVSR
jgi:hypothetical protein